MRVCGQGKTVENEGFGRMESSFSLANTHTRFPYGKSNLINISLFSFYSMRVLTSAFHPVNIRMA